jgi:hypothetical protein
MTEMLQRAITATTLRAAIRAKIRVGVTPRAISLLIIAHASPDARGERKDPTGVQRIAVEKIPNGRRAAFVAALDQLQDDLLVDGLDPSARDS